MATGFSKRTNWDVGESAFAAAVRAAREAEATGGRRLIDLTVSNPTVCGFDYDEATVLGALGAPGAMVYEADARGMRSAREAVAAYYAGHGAVIDPDALVLTTSTSEAYSYLFRLLCDAGDEVLVARPSYPLFDFLADLEDVRLRSYPLFYDYGWWIDFAELERQIGPRTKAILVVHPNNPTGHWTAATERKRLGELCVQYGLALIVDEVFLDYPLDPSTDAASFAVDVHPALTFILSGMSKIAALPQMKVAWLLTFGPGPLQKKALDRLEVIADTFLSLNAPAQYALPRWLAGARGIQSQILGRIQRNLQILSEHEIHVLLLQAGWNAVVRLSQTAEELIQRFGVIVHPGSFYGISETNRIVISLILPEAQFLEAVKRLASGRG